MKHVITNHTVQCKARANSTSCRKLALCSICGRVLLFGQTGWICPKCGEKQNENEVKI